MPISTPCTFFYASVCYSCTNIPSSNDHIHCIICITKLFSISQIFEI